MRHTQVSDWVKLVTNAKVQQRIIWQLKPSKSRYRTNLHRKEVKVVKFLFAVNVVALWI